MQDSQFVAQLVLTSSYPSLDVTLDMLQFAQKKVRLYLTKLLHVETYYDVCFTLMALLRHFAKGVTAKKVKEQWQPCGYQGQGLVSKI